MKIAGDPQIEARPGEAPLAALLHAVHFAADQHRDQRRKGEDASPYINHPIAVAELLASVAGVDDVEVLQAAVLHDVVEDTEVTVEELVERFGPRVAGLVLEVTDDKDLPGERRKELQVESAPRLSPEAKLIRVADKICNVFDVAVHPPAGWTPLRRQSYVMWTARVVDGCRGVSPRLEARFDTVCREAAESIAREV